ncbi:MAG: amino acid adenylation domain-containing protein [Mycolicibacterium neoaurum]|uniref:non-ribosomal peptide synthetase n=1 Tax=Mycolicibacterium neoaurum TaxID=1795 RepID=UPI002FF8394F
MAEQVLHHMFWRHAERLPGSLALSHVTEAGRSELSYAELEKASRRMADALADTGLPPRTPVVIIADRGPSMVIAMFGTLTAGGVFVVANPAHPVDRVRHVINAARPGAILIDDDAPQEHRRLVEEEFAHLPHLSTTPAASTSTRLDRPDVTCNDPAYIAFTSGSTGLPKGIPHRHATLQQFVDWQAVAFGVSSGSRVAALAPPGFDVSFCEIFGALTRGASVHLVSDEIRNDPAALVQWLREERISLLQIVSGHWATLLAEIEQTGADLPHLATVLFVGEALSPSVVARSRQLLSATTKLVNVYGPTEVVAATFYPIGELPPDLGTVPIGHAIPGRTITLRDQDGAVVDEGEICIASSYLAKGYLNDDAATESRFVTLPDTDEVIYRTGDGARRLPSGELLFVGRTDNQVKINGQRVELEDVEAAVMNTGAVLAAAADVRTSPTGAMTLVVFAVAQRADDFDPESVREQLATALPAYMVPAVVIAVEHLPRNANGKIDRAAVAQLAAPKPDEDDGDQPAGEMEQAIAEIWQDLLKQQGISRSANLFRIGGDSLVATRILSRVRKQFGVRISLGTFIDDPTIQGLAIAAASAPASPVIGGTAGVRAAR